VHDSGDDASKKRLQGAIVASLVGKKEGHVATDGPGVLDPFEFPFYPGRKAMEFISIGRAGCCDLF
jgi:hypothetical protein